MWLDRRVVLSPVKSKGLNVLPGVPVVSFENVNFAFDGLPVLEQANLTVGQNELMCIVGPNGGGKTTLLKLILGILQPQTGTVRVFGDTPERARRRVGYMPQHVHYDPQFPVTALDIVLMGRLGQAGLPGLFGWHGRANREVALEALREVEMVDLADRPFSALSGGQRQRVLIARALSCQPQLLLLDEPTANVDPRAEERLFDILRALNQRMTILIVSHDLGFVPEVVKSVICVNRRVVVHPTSDITGEVIKDIYGGDLRMVRHDHRCSEKGHTHG
ncbi:MAG: metal ABC transporter ATP-binding protein [bacterium]